MIQSTNKVLQNFEKFCSRCNIDSSRLCGKTRIRVDRHFLPHKRKEEIRRRQNYRRGMFDDDDVLPTKRKFKLVSSEVGSMLAAIGSH